MKGFRSRVRLGQVKRSVLRILMIKGWQPHLHGLSPLHVFKYFYLSMSSNDRFLNFVVMINMLFT